MTELPPWCGKRSCIRGDFICREDIKTCRGFNTLSESRGRACWAVRAWAAVEALTKHLFENLPPMFRRRGPPLTPFSCLPPEQRKNKRVPLLKSSGTRIKPNTIKKENRRFSKRRNEVSHKALLPTFLSRKVGQPLRVSAQAAYLATFSSQAALLSPLARM